MKVSFTVTYLELLHVIPDPKALECSQKPRGQQQLKHEKKLHLYL